MKIFNKIFGMMLVIVLVSCSNDDDNVKTQPITHENLLLKTTDEDGLVNTYTYDSDNKLVNYKLNGNAYNPSRDYNFIYNENGTLNKVIQAVGGAVINEYFYDSNKKLIKQIANKVNIYEYAYEGNVLSVNLKNTSTNSRSRESYTYNEKGNIIEVKSYSQITDVNPEGTYSGVVNYTYDNKKRSSSSLPIAFLFPASVNNIVTTQYNGGAVYTSKYEYNTDDFPIKRTDSFTRVYEYKQL